MYLTNADVLTVGFETASKALCSLPIKVLAVSGGTEAIEYLRSRKIDAVVSKWELADMPGGMLFGQILAAKPSVITVALVDFGNYEQEIAARKLGISVVVDDSIGDESFRELICQLLGIRVITETQAIIGKK